MSLWPVFLWLDSTHFCWCMLWGTCLMCAHMVWCFSGLFWTGKWFWHPLLLLVCCSFWWALAPWLHPQKNDVLNCHDETCLLRFHLTSPHIEASGCQWTHNGSEFERGWILCCMLDMVGLLVAVFLLVVVPFWLLAQVHYWCQWALPKFESCTTAPKTRCKAGVAT